MEIFNSQLGRNKITTLLSRCFNLTLHLHNSTLLYLNWLHFYMKNLEISCRPATQNEILVVF